MFGTLFKGSEYKNPEKVLIERVNIYFAGNGKLFFEFLQEHYESDIEVKQYEEINNIRIWNFKGK